ncbi:hypothetical protein, partial [Adlercreutzia equolifaciens]|uniref:hypothetical protein n=1 Tax=Adlercreutzia equolifaciens TaxID=446660 RepID=UPI003AEF8C26
DAEDFHIARASPSIRAVSRMDVLLPAIIGQRARRRMRYPHSAKEDLIQTCPVVREVIPDKVGILHKLRNRFLVVTATTR